MIIDVTLKLWRHLHIWYHSIKETSSFQSYCPWKPNWLIPKHYVKKHQTCVYQRNHITPCYVGWALRSRWCSHLETRLKLQQVRRMFPQQLLCQDGLHRSCTTSCPSYNLQPSTNGRGPTSGFRSEDFGFCLSKKQSFEKLWRFNRVADSISYVYQRMSLPIVFFGRMPAF